MIERMITMAQGVPQELLLIHLEVGEDITEGILKACKEHGVQDGYVLGATGKLSVANVFTAAPIGVKDGKLLFGYMDEPIPFGGLLGAPCLNNIEGVLCRMEDTSETALHMHYSFSDPDGFARGGHLPGKNLALEDVTIMVGVISKVDMVRKWDDSVNIFVFAPQQKD